MFFDKTTPEQIEQLKKEHTELLKIQREYYEQQLNALNKSLDADLAALKDDLRQKRIHEFEKRKSEFSAMLEQANQNALEMYQNAIARASNIKYPYLKEKILSQAKNTYEDSIEYNKKLLEKFFGR